jgi:hypothetical protein
VLLLPRPASKKSPSLVIGCHKPVKIDDHLVRGEILSFQIARSEIESSTMRGFESIDVQRQVSPPNYASVSQTYDLMLQKLENHVTNPDGGSRSLGLGVNNVDYER